MNKVLKSLGLAALSLSAAAIALPSQAALTIHYAGGGEVVDTDGVVGLADVDTAPGAVVNFDLVTDSAITAAGTGSVQILDTTEIATVPFDVTISSGAIGDVVGSFSLTMAAPGIRPHDDLGDFNVIYQSVGATNGPIDVQTTVPEPVTILGSAMVLGIGAIAKKRQAKS